MYAHIRYTCNIACMCGNQRKTGRTWLSPTMWDLGIELRSLVLAAFIH